MAKYNIQPKKEKMARYQTLLSEETKDRLHDDILRMLVSEQKYKDPAYNSRRLAEDLGTNSRYISAVCATRFHKNYSELVNDYRVNDAMSLLTDKRYAKMSVQYPSEFLCKLLQAHGHYSSSVSIEPESEIRESKAIETENS